MTRVRPLLPTLASCLIVGVVLPAGARARQTDSVAVADVVGAFHQALRDGDAEAVRALLAADVVVAESGGLETREEYLAHHMGADMAFASAVTREPGSTRVTVAGDVAWVTSTSRTRGTWRERPVDSVGAELMVLSRSADGWRIRAIHWSSRRAG